MVRTLHEQGANPTVDGAQRDWAEVPGIEAPGTEGADDPKLTFLHAVCPSRERMKLSSSRVAVYGRGIWQRLSVDNDAGDGNLYRVTGPYNHRLDERRKPIWAGTHGNSIVRLAQHPWPANIGAEKHVRRWIVRSARRIGNLAVDPKWCRMRVVEDEAEADPRYHRAYGGKGDWNKNTTQAREGANR